MYSQITFYTIVTQVYAYDAAQCMLRIPMERILCLFVKSLVLILQKNNSLYFYLYKAKCDIQLNHSQTQTNNLWFVKVSNICVDSKPITSILKSILLKAITACIY